MTKSRGILAPRNNWTAGEESIVRDLYPDIPCADIAALLGRKPGSVYQAANRLGLEKSEYFKTSDMSGRVSRGKQLPQMIANRFKPGHTSWNKGTHFVAPGRSAETRFKKGRKPEESRNYRPIGSLRLTKEGYLEQKVTDDPRLVPARRWASVHRLVWQAAHGPIPKGHIVGFKQGMFTNKFGLITPDRLECMTMRQNVQRNSIWRKDPEVAKLYQLKGAITRQVNRLIKSNHKEQTP